MLLFCTLLTKDARERSPSWPLWLVATDLAARLMPQGIRKSRANPPKAPIGKFEHQSGKIDQTLERFAPGEAGGWGDSPRGVERIAPLGSLPPPAEEGIVRTTRAWVGTNRARAGTNQRREPVVSGLEAGRAGG